MSHAIERAFAYVANAESRELLVFRMDLASGELTLIEDVLGGKFTTLAHTPDRRFMFAGLRDEPFGIASFAIDPARGMLRALGETRMPGPLAFLSTDRTGRWLLSASYHNDFVAVSEIDASGQLREPHQIIESIPKAHAIVVAPTNDVAIATSLGSDMLIAWRFDATSGRLLEQERTQQSVAAGAGPRHIRFHPQGRQFFVLCELDGSIRAFDFDPAALRMEERAAASVVPKGFRGKRWAAELQITPDGNLLYASERTSSTLAGFNLDGANGIDAFGSVSTERQPRAFAIDPSGRFLLAVGQKSNRLSLYSIDGDGSLTKLNEYAVGQDPCWVDVLVLER
jgi:6-phosphogluconolactonase